MAMTFSKKSIAGLIAAAALVLLFTSLVLGLFVGREIQRNIHNHKDKRHSQGINQISFLEQHNPKKLMKDVQGSFANTAIKLAQNIDNKKEKAAATKMEAPFSKREQVNPLRLEYLGIAPLHNAHTLAKTMDLFLYNPDTGAISFKKAGENVKGEGLEEIANVDFGSHKDEINNFIKARFEKNGSHKLDKSIKYAMAPSLFVALTQFGLIKMADNDTSKAALKDASTYVRGKATIEGNRSSSTLALGTQFALHRRNPNPITKEVLTKAINYQAPDGHVAATNDEIELLAEAPIGNAGAAKHKEIESKILIEEKIAFSKTLRDNPQYVEELKGLIRAKYTNFDIEISTIGNGVFTHHTKIVVHANSEEKELFAPHIHQKPYLSVSGVSMEECHDHLLSKGMVIDDKDKKLDINAYNELLSFIGQKGGTVHLSSDTPYQDDLLNIRVTAGTEKDFHSRVIPASHRQHLRHYAGPIVQAAEGISSKEKDEFSNIGTSAYHIKERGFAFTKALPNIPISKMFQEFPERISNPLSASQQPKEGTPPPPAASNPDPSKETSQGTPPPPAASNPDPSTETPQKPPSSEKDKPDSSKKKKKKKEKVHTEVNASQVSTTPGFREKIKGIFSKKNKTQPVTEQTGSSTTPDPSASQPKPEESNKPPVSSTTEQTGSSTSPDPSASQSKPKDSDVSSTTEQTGSSTSPDPSTLQPKSPETGLQTTEETDLLDQTDQITNKQDSTQK